MIASGNRPVTFLPCHLFMSLCAVFWIPSVGEPAHHAHTLKAPPVVFIIWSHQKVAWFQTSKSLPTWAHSSLRTVPLVGETISHNRDILHQATSEKYNRMTTKNGGECGWDWHTWTICCKSTYRSSDSWTTIFLLSWWKTEVYCFLQQLLQLQCCLEMMLGGLSFWVWRGFIIWQNKTN